MAPYSKYHLTSVHSSVVHQSVLAKSATSSYSEDVPTGSSYHQPTTATISPPPTLLYPSVIPQIQEQQQKIAAMTDIVQLGKGNPRLTSASNSHIDPATSRQQYTDNDECNDPPLLLTEAIHPNKYKMKQQRRGATAIGIVSGAVIGTMVFPVLGTAVGGAAAGYACNKLSKRGERRAQRRWEQTSFQRQAFHSPAVDAVYV
jgi:hypothetical protein